MKNLNNRINEALINLAEQSTEAEKCGYLQLWQLKNDRIKSFDLSGIENYVKNQVELGYSSDDLIIKAALSTHHEWYSYIFIIVKNPINGESYNSGSVKFLSPEKLLKAELIEAEAPLRELIGKNRETYLNNKEAASAFISSGKFLQNNLSAMNFDQETHDYVLSIKKAEKEAEKTKEEEAKTALRIWAIKEGSDLLKLRVKHNQNWLSLAMHEKVLTILPEFTDGPDDAVDDYYEINNASLKQLRILNEYCEKFPDIDFDILRYKYFDNETSETWHQTFIRGTVNFRNSSVYLYKDIVDIDDDE